MNSTDHSITTDADQAWQDWEAELSTTWELKASELSTMNYQRIPDNYFGSVFEKDGGVFYLSRKLGSAVWEVNEFTQERAKVIRERG